MKLIQDTTEEFLLDTALFLLQQLMCKFSY